MKNFLWGTIAVLSLSTVIALSTVLISEINVSATLIFAIIGWLILGSYAWYRYIKM